MEAPLIVYALVLLLIAWLLAPLAAAAWRRRPAPGAAALSGLLLAVSGWALAYALELLTPDLADKVFWAQVEYAGIVLVPPAWLAFALSYTQVEIRRPWRAGAVLAVEPALVLGLVWTNPWHHLIWRDLDLDPATPGALLVVTHGPAFWLHLAYAYALLLAGGGLLGRALLRFPRAYRAQAGAVLLACACPWLGNALYLLGWTPLPGLDLTPFAFAAAGLAFSRALGAFHLLDLVPVARATVLDHLSEGVLVLDAQDRIVDLNPAAARTLDRGAAMLVGQPATGLPPPWGALIGQWDRLGAGRDLAVGAGSAARCYSLTITPLRARCGTLSGRVLTWRDVTEQRHQLATSQRLIAELARARTAAEAATEAKTSFLEILSYNLRTPLTSLMGYSDLLHEDLQEVGCGVGLADLARVEAAEHRLLVVIDEVLALTRLETDEIPLERDWVPVASLADDLRVLAGPLAARQGNSFALELDGAPERIYTDRARLHRVLAHLLGNAARFTTAGQIVLRVSRASDGEEVYFAIRDTGPGLTAEQLAEFFPPEPPGPDPAPPTTLGKGLGLAVCRQLCWLLGGDLRATSAPGVGTTVQVCLPVRAPTLSATCARCPA